MASRIEVVGLKPLLNELRKYEPELYRQIRDELIGGSSDLVSAVGNDFPDKPLGNWHSTGGRQGASRMPPYNAQKARKGIKAVMVIGGRNHGILRLEQRDAGGQVYDSAGGANMSRFVKNIEKHSSRKSKPPRSRSRVMYPSVAHNIGLIEDNILKAIGKTDKMVQTRIVGNA